LLSAKMMPFYGRNTMGAGVRGAARLDLTRTDAKEMTLVLQDTPELTSYGGIVAPIPPPPAHATAWPFRFEGGEVFSTDEPTVVEQRQQDQKI
jgi:hypothetical protein